jgi:iron complex transport system ATP-binding protein
MRTDTIQLDHLTIGYDAKHPIATDISCTLAAGEMTCLIGANGVGKSTLLKTIAGLRPDIAIVLTERPDVRNLTVSEVVALGRTPYTNFWGTLSKNDHFIVSESMKQVGITALAQRNIGELSDGERQKVMVAKALAQQTPVILLDEPTAFLDYHSRIEMFRLLQHLAHEQQKAILLSTHDIELATRYADMFWVMENGTLTVEPPETIKEKLKVV